MPSPIRSIVSNSKHSRLYRTDSYKRRLTTTTTTSSTNALCMALIFAPLSDLNQCLVLGVPTGEQYTAYWGRTSRERINAIFESCTITFLGLFASYFLSFVIGTSLATLFGSVAAFWILLGPQWKAYQRNRELIGPRKLVDPYYANDGDSFYRNVEEEDDDEYDFNNDSNMGLFGAYYIASVQKVAVVESTLSPEEDELDIRDFYDYTMETDENEKTTGSPWMLRLNIGDRYGRDIQVHARMSEDYVNIRKGMPCASILLSTDKNFHILSGLTDFYIPDARCCVGDYPYLDKFNFGRILNEEGLLEVFDQEDQQWMEDEVDDDDDDDGTEKEIVENMQAVEDQG